MLLNLLLLQLLLLCLFQTILVVDFRVVTRRLWLLLLGAYRAPDVLVVREARRDWAHLHGLVLEEAVCVRCIRLTL